VIGTHNIDRLPAYIAQLERKQSTLIEVHSDQGESSKTCLSSATTATRLGSTSSTVAMSSAPTALSPTREARNVRDSWSTSSMRSIA
jgi:hypothetical protein